MKSGKTRRAEIRARRTKRAARAAAAAKAATVGPMIPVNDALLAPYNSYGAPDFVRRGYYLDIPFRCIGCGVDEVWTGAQQKWWYEIAKGFVYSTAIRCRACRRKERSRRDEARRVHFAGMAKKRSDRK
ncbi:MAG TPA: zinc-ribbon domain containing protein [Candidatus Binatia bacterium]|nr:zinc-ribbon domain containing protein [Candidatus Binatia bacterium]